MGYSARRGFTNGKISGAARQAELQQKIAAMQEKMTEAQDAVEAQEFTASVGGGVVEAKVNGKKEVLSVTIKPEAVDPEDVEMLQDLVLAAVNEVLRKVEETSSAEMGKITGGLSLLGVVITNMMAARRAEQRMVTAQAVTDARLEELTREVRAHNNFAQRVPVLEEQLRVANHRLSNLEKAHTPAGRAIS